MTPTNLARRRSSPSPAPPCPTGEGTLFLDGIEELSLTGQARLMLSLAGLWGDDPTDRLFASVRVIAGTHGDLPAAVERGAFRPDLFRELAPVTVDIPPLRARLKNLPRVVEDARRRFNADYALAVDGVTPAALAALAVCPWPGNDWHLHRVLEESMLVTQRGWLTPEHLIWRPIPRTPPVVAGLVASAAAAPPGGRGGAPAARPSAATRAALALHLASRTGGISSGDLARACGVSAEAARLDLVALARAGHLQPVGGGRRTRYVPTNPAGADQDDARDAVAASAAAHVGQEA